MEKLLISITLKYSYFKLVSNYTIYEFSKWTHDFVKAIKQTWFFVGFVTKKAKRAWWGVVERKWHNEIVFLQVFIYVFCDVFKAIGVYVCVCIKITFCGSFSKQELCVVLSWDLGCKREGLQEEKGVILFWVLNVGPLYGSPLTIAQSSTWEDNNKAKDMVTWRMSLKQPKINQEIHVYSL